MAPALEHYVVPLTVVILVILFSVQSSGTARVASAFGPVMVIWFGVLAVLGLIHIGDDPSVLAAINPWHAIHFLLAHGTIGLVTLGAVFLAVTGGEALYADLGHFGRRPIRGWLYLSFPSLLINYFGQGASCSRIPPRPKTRFTGWTRNQLFCRWSCCRPRRR